MTKKEKQAEALRAWKEAFGEDAGAGMPAEGPASKPQDNNGMKGGNENYNDNEGKAQAEPAGTGQPCTAAVAQAGGYEPENGYYELKDCRVKETGPVQRFRAGTSEESQMRTVVFEYKPKKSEKMAVICADGWNETIRYNDFAEGSWYDLSLRISARQGKDGRWWPSVSIVFAHRLREVER